MPLFSPLKDRFDTLPLILCGPIVRRVETELVTVWVALKEPRKISLELYTGYCSPPDATFTGKTVAFTSTPTDTIAVGSNLHIGLVTIDTQGLLTPGGIVSYNLLFSGTNVPDSNLISLGLLNEPVVLGFKAGQLPSFQVAPLKLEDLRIAHGSCRKPHGEGRDGLAILAKVMETDFTDPARANDSQVRPHCLFHTGDQIYADDVSAFLAPLLNDAGIQLLGIIESLPLPRLTTEKPDKKFPVLKPDLSNLAEEVSWIDATAEKWPMMRRATNYYSGFSGDETNHLTAFGEFCAAYLFQWSNVLWPDALPDPGALFDARLSQSTSSSALYLKQFLPKPDNFDQLSPDEKKKYDDSVAEARKTFVAKAARPGSDRHSVLEFKAGLVLVRRALANVPSIMIFDDHDVTDDWYLTGGWSKRALGNPFGRTIIRNALAAFALFQGSGNDPKLYQKADSPQAQLIASFKTLLGKYRKSTASPSEITPEQGKQILTDADKIDQLLGFNDFTSPPVKWHCSFRLGATKVYALDTRTRRDFSDGLNFPPNLIGPQALAEQLPDTALPAGIELAVIISAAPVLALATMEAIGQPIVSRVLDAVHMGKEGTENKDREVPHKGHESLDIEAWSINQKGFEAFLKRCAPLKKVVFLSGDVHYGISAELDYYKKGEPEASRFVQMVASSFKNSKPEGQLLGLLPAAFAQTALAGGLNREFSELDLFAWEEDADIKNLKFRFQTEPGQFRDANPGEFPLRYAYALKKKPVFFPLRDWPLTVFQPKDGSGNPIGDETILKRIVLGSAVPQPSYRWRMKIEIDDRPDNIRLASLGAGFLLDPTADLPNQIDAGSQSSFDAILKRNSFFSRSHMSRFVNWYSHVAFVHFEKKDTSFNTFHSQFFQPDLPGDEFKPTDTELTYKPGTFQQPYFRHTISLKNAVVADQPTIPTEVAGMPI